MSIRRHSATGGSSTDSKHGSPGPSKKRARLRSKGPAGSPFEGEERRPIKVYIVQVKMDGNTVTKLYRLIERFAPSDGGTLQLELCSEAKAADVVLTAVRMKRRFERHVSWDIAKQKAIVTPNWLIDSDKSGRPLPCADYAALPELEEATAENCPDKECPQSPSRKYTVCTDGKVVKPTDASVFDNWRARYAVQRASPLVCPNQGLVNELSVLCRDRELEGLAENTLAYERAIGMVKSYPGVVTHKTFQSDLAKLPGLGDKVKTKILEYIDQGFINEAQTTRSSERYQSLSHFTSIYNIGPTKARQFYDMGMRTMADFERYYDIPPNPDPRFPRQPELVDELLEGLDKTSGLTPNGKLIRKEGKAPELSIPVAIVLKDELDKKIPRAEVEEMRDAVLKELEVLQPGCVSMVVGGYRRGKLMSNDMDIVISHLDDKKGKDIIPGLCKRLIAQLYRKGLVTHVMHLSGFHAYNALREEHWDSLEKALTVFRLPPSEENPVRIHRRVDLIFALPESYWTAVIGWSGSKMFQRDLRLWAKQEKGMKFDSIGLTRRHDSKRFLPKTEEEVFQILGLPWIDPTMRNADA